MCLASLNESGMQLMDFMDVSFACANKDAIDDANGDSYSVTKGAWSSRQSILND